MIRTIIAGRTLVPGVSRRGFTLAAAALPLTLGACGEGAKVDLAEIDRKLKSAAADAKVIASALKSVLAQISALDIPRLTPQAITIAGTAIAGITQVADSLERATTIAAAQPLVEKLSTYAQAVVGALAAVPLPKEINTALRAAVILIPVVELMVGLAANRLQANDMTEDQARGVLLAAGR